MQDKGEKLIQECTQEMVDNINKGSNCMDFLLTPTIQSIDVNNKEVRAVVAPAPPFAVIQDTNISKEHMEVIKRQSTGIMGDFYVPVFSMDTASDKDSKEIYILYNPITHDSKVLNKEEFDKEKILAKESGDLMIGISKEDSRDIFKDTDKYFQTTPASFLIPHDNISPIDIKDSNISPVAVSSVYSAQLGRPKILYSEAKKEELAKNRNPIKDMISNRSDNKYTMTVLRVKDSDKWKICNLTKGHICKCEFDSDEEAWREIFTNMHEEK